MELAQRMEKLKEQLDKDDEELSDMEEEEEESEDEEEKKEEKKKDNPDDFEMLKYKVKAKMPKKIAAKGIVSSLRPIEEENGDDIQSIMEPEAANQRADEIPETDQTEPEPPVAEEFQNKASE